jgi:hypothetical protein
MTRGGARNEGEERWERRGSHKEGSGGGGEGNPRRVSTCVASIVKRLEYSPPPPSEFSSVVLLCVQLLDPSLHTFVVYRKKMQGESRKIKCFVDRLLIYYYYSYKKYGCHPHQIFTRW